MSTIVPLRLSLLGEGQPRFLTHPLRHRRSLRVTKDKNKDMKEPQKVLCMGLLRALRVTLQKSTLGPLNLRPLAREIQLLFFHFKQ